MKTSEAPKLYKVRGHVIAQVISLQLPTVAIRFRSHVGFLFGRMALAQIFSQYPRFPCQFLFHILPRIYYLCRHQRRIVWKLKEFKETPENLTLVILVRYTS
jgi:hypothetical protein